MAALVAVPAVYQLFRMGYYAQLVPNPAVTKSAARAQWGQGWTYLRDLLGTYWLLVPLGLLAGIVAVQCVDDLRGRDRLRCAARLAPVAAALAHAVYVVRLGGDFMHARMLLPAVFAVAAPVGVRVDGILLAWPAGGRLRIDRRRALPAVAAGLLVSWAVVCAAALRPDLSSAGYEPAAISADGIGDERAFDVMAWERENPVSEDDYPFALPVPRTGFAALDLLGDGWPDHAAALTDGLAVRSVSSTCGCRRIRARPSSGSATADPPGQAVGGSAVGRQAARKPPDCFCQRVA